MKKITGHALKRISFALLFVVLLTGATYAADAKIIGPLPMPTYDEDILSVSVATLGDLDAEQWISWADVYFSKARAANSVWQALSDGVMAVYCVMRADVETGE